MAYCILIIRLCFCGVLHAYLTVLFKHFMLQIPFASSVCIFIDSMMSSMYLHHNVCHNSYILSLRNILKRNVDTNWVIWILVFSPALLYSEILSRDLATNSLTESLVFSSEFNNFKSNGSNFKVQSQFSWFFHQTNLVY